MRFGSWTLKLMALTCASAMAFTAAAERPRISVSLGAATDVLWRGLSLNDGHPTPNLTFFAAHDSGFTGSLSVLQSNHLGLFNDGRSDRDVEIQANLNYRHELSDTWTSALGVSNHEIIRKDKAPDWDWYEFNVSAEHASGIAFTIWYTPRVFGHSWDSVAFSIAKQLLLPLSSVAELELGISHIDSNKPATYPFARVAFAIPVSPNFDFGAEYQFSGTEASKPFAEDRTGSAVLVRGSFHFDL